MSLDKFKKEINQMSVSALANLAIDIRGQVNAGLLSNKEAHDQINVISVVMMRKQLIENNIDIEDCEDEDENESLWKEPSEGGQSRGDELMTNGWED